MTGACIPQFMFWLVVLMVVIWAPTGAAQTKTPNDQVTMSPAAVVAGSPELIRVHVPASAEVEGEWLGQKLEFFRGRDGQAWFALAGVDVESEAGPSILRITAHMAAGERST